MKEGLVNLIMESTGFELGSRELHVSVLPSALRTVPVGAHVIHCLHYQGVNLFLLHHIVKQRNITALHSFI